MASTDTSTPTPQQQPVASTSTTPAVYLPPTAVAPPPDLPDEAYDLTPAEAQSVLAGIAKRAKDDSVLRTGAMRARDAAPVRRWDEAKIRIKFADRTIVQQSFPSDAPLADVYAFVRLSLAPTHTESQFTLYIPPNQILPEQPPSPIPRSKLPPHKRNAPPPPVLRTLSDHGLAPSSVLSVRFADPALNRPEAGAPLRAELLAKAQELPVAGTTARATQAAEEKGTDVKVEVPKKEGEGRKMPKWFKGPGKK